jgi:ubiquinone/menaquinone biosynthesis C-methylase UbiE
MDADDFEISPEATRRRIREAHGPVTQRDWDGILFDFDLVGVKPEYWTGKTILDVGSGLKMHNPEIAFPGAKVCAVDPQVGARVYSQTAHEVRKGVAQEIPYDDNKFDLVISSHAVPQHVSRPDFLRAISEMIRVMKPGGEIRMTPCVESYDISANLEIALADSGFEVDFIRDEKKAITIIRLSEMVGNNISSKRKAWEKLHKKLFSNEEIRPVF